jgi:hypothetical protein
MPQDSSVGVVLSYGLDGLVQFLAEEEIFA